MFRPISASWRATYRPAVLTRAPGLCCRGPRLASLDHQRASRGRCSKNNEALIFEYFLVGRWQTDYLPVGAQSTMFDELVGHTDSSATRPGRMTEVLDCVGKQFGADPSFLSTSHADTEPHSMLPGHQLYPGSGRPVCQRLEYREYFGACGSQAQHDDRGVVVIGEELVPGHDLYKGKSYGGFTRQHGMPYMLGSVVFDGTERRTQTPFTNLCGYRQAGRALSPPVCSRQCRTSRPQTSARSPSPPHARSYARYWRKTAIRGGRSGPRLEQADRLRQTWKGAPGWTAHQNVS